MAGGFAHHQRHMPVPGPVQDRFFTRRDQTHGPNGGGGQDRAAIGFIIQGYIARHDRHIQREAGLANPIQRPYELAHDRRFFGVAKIQVVGGGKGFCPYCT